MAGSHYTREEAEFRQAIPLDRPELLVPADTPLPTDVRERIRRKTMAKIAIAPPQRVRRRLPRWAWGVATAATAVAAVLLTLLLPTTLTGNVVQAMEHAMLNLSSYHGVMEMSWEGEAPRERTEIWWAGDQFRVEQSDGSSYYSDGTWSWVISQASRSASRSPSPWGARSEYLDLRGMAQFVLAYPAREVGQEQVAGRQAVKLEVTRPGGRPAYVWLDGETHLPVQLQRFFGGHLQTYTFTTLEVNPDLKPELFTYHPPADYTVEESRTGYRYVRGKTEATAVAGFTPAVPQEAPRRWLAREDSVLLDYGDVVIRETWREEPWNISHNYPLGSAGGVAVIVGPEYLIWQQGQTEFEVHGTGGRRITLARQLAPDLTLPDPTRDLVSAAALKLAPNLEAARQMQFASDDIADGGGTTGALDAAFRFTNGVSPYGSEQRQPFVPGTSFRVVADTGAQAVVEATEGPYARIYLQRLVRQDASGVWSIVGYDLR